MKQKNMTVIPRRRKQQAARRPLLSLLVCLLMIVLVSVLMAGAYVAALARDLPSITMEQLSVAQTSFVYDQEGRQVAALHGGEQRTVVELGQMPQQLLDALVAAEDVRFYQHHGVDLRSIARALVVDAADTLRNRELTFTQGASTLTMQLVKNVVEDAEKTIPRKIKQALLALQFEKDYDKDEILYYYLNEIYLARQTYGVEAASEYYFNKHVSQLTLAEAATLVAILRAPAYYNPYTNPAEVVNIRNTVLESMIAYQPQLYGDSARQAQAEPLALSTAAAVAPAYDHPWFTDAAINEAMGILQNLGMEPSLVYTGGLSITVTVDAKVQQALEAVYADDSNFPDSNSLDQVESAMVVVDPQTGAIRGLVGGRDYETRLGFNRAVDMRRSCGSSIKPIVTYGPALDLGYSSNYIMEDEPISIGDWSPQNDDHSYMGKITMRTAVIHSRNVCAARLSDEIGVYTGWEYANRLGLQLPETDIVRSLTLGGLTYGVSPKQMAAAYAAFANAGLYTAPYCVASIKNAAGQLIYEADPWQEQVFSDTAAYIMTDILVDAVNLGTGSNARVSGWPVAGKTGTNGLPDASEDPDFAGKSGTRDAWFCGYTPQLAAAVWMGYDQKKDDEGNLQYLSNVYGGTYPARLFSTVMSLALQDEEPQQFVRPDGVPESELYNMVIEPEEEEDEGGGHWPYWDEWNQWWYDQDLYPSRDDYWQQQQEQQEQQEPEQDESQQTNEWSEEALRQLLETMEQHQ